MRQTFFVALTAVFSFSITGLLLFQAIPDFLVRMFNDDPDLTSLGAEALRIISLSFPFTGPGIFAASVFQALGRGFPGLVISVLRMLVILMPLIYVLGKFYGLNAIWYAFPVTELVSTAIAGVWIFTAFRKLGLFSS